jgi:hypothetical protein
VPKPLFLFAIIIVVAAVLAAKAPAARTAAAAGNSGMTLVPVIASLTLLPCDRTGLTFDGSSGLADLVADNTAEVSRVDWR